MVRHTRVQAAIVQNDHILLIKHREHQGGHEYWLLPGGGLEPGESEEIAVCREAQEETCLTVLVERLLLDERATEDTVYQKFRTYLCRPVSGEASPGYEPEADASAVYGITEVGWFDLRDEQSWGQQVVNDLLTYPRLKQIQGLLGYSPNDHKESGT